jgi:hypothetical protein
MTMIVTKLSKRSRPRLITVINNQPWYQSTGKNSGFAGTWFFFGGVLEKKSNQEISHWLIKPGSLATGRYSNTLFFGKKTIDFVRKHAINKSISFSRFGDIEKICISASLGGGFWMSTNGQLLEKYLRDNYPKYFLSTDVVKIIQENAKRKDLPLYTDSHLVNNWLIEQGVASVGLLHNESLLFKPF